LGGSFPWGVWSGRVGGLCVVVDTPMTWWTVGLWLCFLFVQSRGRSFLDDD
jgi:hypothetical protein